MTTYHHHHIFLLSESQNNIHTLFSVLTIFPLKVSREWPDLHANIDSLCVSIAWTRATRWLNNEGMSDTCRVLDKQLVSGVVHNINMYFLYLDNNQTNYVHLSTTFFCQFPLRVILVTFRLNSDRSAISQLLPAGTSEARGEFPCGLCKVSEGGLFTPPIREKD